MQSPFWSHELLGNLNPVKTTQRSRRIHGRLPDIGFTEAMASSLGPRCSFTHYEGNCHGITSPVERPKWGDPGSQDPLCLAHRITCHSSPLGLVLFNTYRYLGSERLRYFPIVKQLEVVQTMNPDKPGSGFSIFLCPQCPLQTYHRVGNRATAEYFGRQEKKVTHLEARKGMV